MKDDIKNKQRLIDSIIDHNSNLIQAQNVFAQKHSVTRKTNDKSIVIPLEITLFEMIKRMSQSFQSMTDLQNFKLVLKIFILRLINRK